MSTVWHTPVAYASAVNSSVVNGPLGQLDAGISTMLATINQYVTGISPFTQLRVGATSTLTISSGSITISRTRHRVDTQGAAATDDLDTITNGVDGDWLRLQIVNAARVVVIKHGTGNIRTSTGQDITISSIYDLVDLMYDATDAVWNAKAIPPSILNRLTPKTNFTAASSVAIAIPANTFETIRLLAMIRGSAATPTLTAIFNADAGANYDNAGMGWTTAATTTFGALAQSTAFSGSAPGSTAAADVYAAFELKITNNQSAVRKVYQTRRSFNDSVGTGSRTDMVDGTWRNTAEITSITLALSAGNFETAGWYAVLGEDLV